MIGITGLLIKKCGLSRSEVAEYCSRGTYVVDTWSIGQEEAPTEIIEKLVKLSDEMDIWADLILKNYNSSNFSSPDKIIELKLSKDNNEARINRWPYVSVHKAVLAQVVAQGMVRGFKFRIVPFKK